MKIVCPFCSSILDSKDDVPETASQVFGDDYICHKVICCNINKHPDHNKITIVFNPEEEKKCDSES